jgi:ADP-heptose:LPS heptosyltransferase
VAAAFQKPTIAIWGNTTPQLGMYPFRTKFINLEVKDLSCRPCSKIGYGACPKGHFKCMQQQQFSTPELQTFIREITFEKAKYD